MRFKLPFDLFRFSRPKASESEAARVSLWRSLLLSLFESSYFTGLRFARSLPFMGRLLLALTVASLAMLWDPGRIPMRYLFTLGLGLFLGAAVSNRIRRPRSLRFERELPAHVFPGEIFEYTLVVTNESSRRSAPLLARDHGRVRFPSAREWLSSRAPFERELNSFDRWMGYPRWLWLVEHKQDVIGFDFQIPPLNPGQSARIRAQGVAPSRGSCLFVGVYCALSDPMGLLRHLFFIPSRQSLLALPRPHPISIPAPSGSRSRQAGPARSLSRSGDSEEFRSLREWRSGDPLRRIDWKATARAGAPIAREYAPEFFLRTALALDSWLPDSLNPSDFELALSCVAHLCFSMDRSDRLVDLLFLGNDSFSLSLGPGSQDHWLALERLALCEPSPRSSLQSLREALEPQSLSVSGLVFACCSWDSERDALVRQALAQGLSVCIIFCSNPSDITFPSGVSVVFPERIES